MDGHSTLMFPQKKEKEKEEKDKDLAEESEDLAQDLTKDLGLGSC